MGLWGDFFCFAGGSTTIDAAIDAIGDTYRKVYRLARSQDSTDP